MLNYKLFKKSLVILMSMSMALLPAPHAEAKMNTQAIVGLAALGVGMTINTRELLTNEAKCVSSSGMAFTECLKAALLVVQVGLLAITIKDLIKSDKESECEGSSCYNDGSPTTTFDPSTTPGTTTGGDTGTADGGDASTLTPQAVLGAIGVDVDKTLKILDDAGERLEKQGYGYNKKERSFSTPRGKISEGSMGSAAGMSAAGLSAAESKSLLEDQERLKNEASKRLAEILKKLGVDESDSGGIGGYGRPSSSGGTGFDPLRYISGYKPVTGSSANVAGLAKSDGQGGQIGVAADNLFGMIRRRYEDQRRNQKFNETANGR